MRQIKPSELACSVVHLALKIYEKSDASIDGSITARRIMKFAEVDQKSVKASTKVLFSFTKSFEKSFPNFKNLRIIYADLLGGHKASAI
jgi:GTP1/Obg family GTP-binding protein